MKQRLLTVLLAGVLGTAVIFSGVTGVFASEAETGEEVQDIKIIGSQEEGAYDVQLKNNTGKDIKEFRIKVSGKTEFDDVDNLLDENDVFAADEERILYYLPELDTADEKTAEEAETTDDTKEKEPVVYDIKLIFADDTEVLVHTFPFGDIKEGEICLEDEVAYLIFESLSLKEEVNTLETETEIAEKIKAASQPAQTQTYNSSSSYNNDDYYYDDYSYDDDDYYYEDNSSYNDYDYDTNDSSSDDEGGNEDSCLDGGLLY